MDVKKWIDVKPRIIFEKKNMPNVYLSNISSVLEEYWRMPKIRSLWASELQVTKDGNPFSEGSNKDFGIIARFSI